MLTKKQMDRELVRKLISLNLYIEKDIEESKKRIDSIQENLVISKDSV